MEPWIDFAKGPLFAFTFLMMVLGLARLALIQAYSLARGGACGTRRGEKFSLKLRVG